jgi:hypothetical protein
MLCFYGSNILVRYIQYKFRLKGRVCSQGKHIFRSVSDKQKYQGTIDIVLLLDSRSLVNHILCIYYYIHKVYPMGKRTCWFVDHK